MFDLLMSAMLAGGAVPAGTPDWVIVTSATGENGQIAAYVVDVASIADKDGGKDAEVQLIASNIQGDMFMHADCAGKRWRITSARYIIDGKTSYETDNGWIDIDKPGASARVFGYICSGGKGSVPVGRHIGSGDPVAPVRAWIASGARF